MENIQCQSAHYALQLYPNVILLLLKATDKRFEGANSNLSRALMAVKTMGIVDTKRYVDKVTKSQRMIELSIQLSFCYIQKGIKIRKSLLSFPHSRLEST